jgi:hypothetical protein
VSAIPPEPQTLGAPASRRPVANLFSSEPEIRANPPPNHVYFTKWNVKKINVLPNFLIHMLPRNCLHCRGIDGAEHYWRIAE